MCSNEAFIFCAIDWFASESRIVGGAEEEEAAANFGADEINTTVICRMEKVRCFVRWGMTSDEKVMIGARIRFKNCILDQCISFAEVGASMS
jgi:hypothetical protein